MDVGCQEILQAVGMPSGLDFFCRPLKVDVTYHGGHAVAAAMCRCQGGLLP
jgi:hypothetical protein